MSVHFFGPLNCHIPTSFFKENPSCFIFIDAGIQHIKSLTETIQKNPPKNLVWLGDHDGMDEAQQLHYTNLFKELATFCANSTRESYNPKKDESDFALALKWYANLKEKPKQNINGFFFHGLLGGKLCHQLAIIGEANSYLKQQDSSHPCLTFLNTNGDLGLIACRKEYSSHLNGPLSLFTLEEQQIHCEGSLDYQGEFPFKSLSSLGLSNIATGDFSIKGKEPFFIIL